jgi:hypothetical protein
MCFAMLKILVSALIFAAIPLSAYAEGSPAANSDPGIEDAPMEDLEPGESTAPYKAGGVKVSASLRKKILELEKIAAEEKDQDDAALERLAEKAGAKLRSLRFNAELVEVLSDRTVDWRIRYGIMLQKNYSVGAGAIGRYTDSLIAIMRDKEDHARVRGMAAIMLLDAARTDSRVSEAMKETAKDPSTPGEVLNSVMTVVGYAGGDDVDMLMELTRREPADFNEIGINLNAIRALGKSKDPRAIGCLLKIFDESEPDSFYNATAIIQFWEFITKPRERELVKPLIVPRFLKLLDDRSRRGSSRREAGSILAYLDVKEAVEPILRWFLPANGFSAKPGGGGNTMDVFFGAEYLARLGDARAIPVLERMIENFAVDSRWTWTQKRMEARGEKYPDDHQDYKHLKQRLKELKEKVKGHGGER